MHDYEQTVSELRKIYDGIEKYCQNCDECCFTYGWIIKSEEKLYKHMCNLVEINEEITCFDSFKKDSKGSRILEVIPRCLFYQNNSCSIHASKPLDCLLYPVKILYSEEEDTFSLVLSMDCSYIRNLSDREITELKNKIKKFFTEIPINVIKEYMQVVKSWSSISKPKKFRYVILREFTGSEFGF
jgi:Fe-S-cluster containining protein